MSNTQIYYNLKDLNGLSGSKLIESDYLLLDSNNSSSVVGYEEVEEMEEGYEPLAEPRPLTIMDFLTNELVDKLGLDEVSTNNFIPLDKFLPVYLIGELELELDDARKLSNWEMDETFN
ncbi:MAG: hypothetical protein Tsb006_1530 [Rickettsiaceae bacterium]